MLSFQLVPTSGGDREKKKRKNLARNQFKVISRQPHYMMIEVSVVLVM